MCGRYAASRSPEDLVEEFEVDLAPPAPLGASWNVAPTDQVYAVVQRKLHRTEVAEGTEPPEEPQRQLRVVRWGLVPSWAKDPSIGSRLINARMETVGEKPAFKRAFATRRALLPADGYYEWYGETRGKKQPFFIHPRDGSTLAMAGLYELWRDESKPDDEPDAWLWSATVLTTEAEDDLGRIHDRMPLLVERADWATWLDPAVSSPDVRSLLVPAAPGRLEAYPVSTAVSNVRNDGPHLVDPLPAEGEPPAEGEATAEGERPAEPDQTALF
jgi:putative SOS response-associated peptidase YedK